ncbi:cysteine-rich receptor-like protein kinase [Tanacetum coccineum]
MNILSWNTRGLGNKSKGSMIGKVVQKHQVDMVWIQETQVFEVRDSVLCCNWSGKEFQRVTLHVEGRSGGLATIWKHDSFSLKSTWEERYCLAILDMGGLVDIQIQNKRFTWFSGDGKKSRIDRMVVNHIWLQMCPTSILIADVKDDSDYVLQGWAAYVIIKKLQSLKIKIKKWNIEVYSKDQCEVSKLKNYIEKFLDIEEERDLSTDEEFKLVQAKLKLKGVKRKFKFRWRVASRITWLKHVDMDYSRFPWDDLELVKLPIEFSSMLEEHLTIEEA